MVVTDTRGIPIDVIFNGVQESDAIRSRGEHLLEKLVHQAPDVMRVSMVIEAKHRHHHQGNVFHVSIHAHCAGSDVDISRASAQNHAHEDVYVAIRDAYKAARRKLVAVGARHSGNAARHERIRYEGNPRHPSMQ